MKKVVKKFKQSLSILLAVAMVVTCVPQTGTLALAAEADTNAIDTVVDDAAELEVSTVDPVAVALSEDTEEISEEGGETPIQPETPDVPAVTAEGKVEVDGVVVTGNALKTSEGVLQDNEYTVTIEAKTGYRIKEDGNHQATWTGDDPITDGSSNLAAKVNSGTLTVTWDAIPENATGISVAIDTVAIWNVTFTLNDTDSAIAKVSYATNADNFTDYTLVDTNEGITGVDNNTQLKLKVEISGRASAAIYDVAVGEASSQKVSKGNSSDAFEIGAITAAKEIAITTTPYYTITTSVLDTKNNASANATVTIKEPSGSNDLKKGADLKFTVKPETGYTIQSVKNNGVDVSKDSNQDNEEQDGTTYTISNVSANVDIKVVVAPPSIETYTVNVKITGAVVDFGTTLGKYGTGQTDKEATESIKVTEIAKANKETPITFSVTPDNGKKLKEVKINSYYEDIPEKGADGSYAFSYTIDEYEETPATINIVVTAEELKDINIVDITYAPQQDKVELYSVTKKTGGEGYEAKQVQALSGKEDGEVLFTFLPADGAGNDNFEVKGVTATVGEDDPVPVGTDSTITTATVGAEDKTGLTVYKLTLGDTAPSLEVTVDYAKAKSNTLNFTFAGKEDTQVQVVGKTDDSTIDEKVNATVTKTQSLSFLDREVTLTATNDNPGYTIDINFENKTGITVTPVTEDVESNTKKYTVTFPAASYNNELNVTITTSPAPSKNTYEAIFEKDEEIGEDVVGYEVTAPKKDPVDKTRPNAYAIPAGSEYFAFNVTVPEFYDPVVTLDSKNSGSMSLDGSDAVKGEAKDGKITYSYTIDASELDKKFEDSEFITVTLGAYVMEDHAYDVTVSYPSGAINATAVLNGKEVENESDDTSITYTVPYNKEIVITATANDNFTISKAITKPVNTESSTKEKEESVSKDKKSVTIKITNPTEAMKTEITTDSSKVLKELEAFPKGHIVSKDVAKNTYSVLYNGTYTVGAVDGSTPLLINNIKILDKDGKELSEEAQAAITADYNINGPSGNITMTNAAAGNTYTVKLTIMERQPVTEGETGSGNYVPVDMEKVYTLNVLALPTAVTVNTDKAISQAVYTTAEYKFITVPAKTDAKVVSEIKAVSDNEAVAEAKIDNGKLVVTANTTGTAKIRFYTLKAANAADVEDNRDYIGTAENASDIALTVAKLLDGADGTEPVVSERTPSDISLKLNLGVPKTVADKLNQTGNTDLNNVNKKLYYKVVVTLKDTVAADNTDGVITTEITKYFAKENGKDSQAEEIKVFSGKSKGEGCAHNFTVKATLLLTDGEINLDENNETTDSVTPEDTGKEGTFDAKTYNPSYESKLKLVQEKKVTSTTVYTTQADAKVAKVQFSTGTTFTEIADTDIKDLTDGYLTGYVDENGYLIIDVPLNATIGKHVLEVYAEGKKEYGSYGDETIYVARTKLNVTVKAGIASLSLTTPSASIMKADAKKKATLKITPNYYSRKYNNKNKAIVPASKKATWDIEVPAVLEEYEKYPTSYAGDWLPLAEATNSKLAGVVTVKNGTVTIDKTFVPSDSIAENTFRVRATAADYIGDSVNNYAESRTGASMPITITKTGSTLSADRLAIVKRESNNNYRIVARTDGKNAVSLTASELKGTELVVLKAGVNASLPTIDSDDIDGAYYSYKSSNAKALEIRSYDVWTQARAELIANKSAKNVSLTVTANDGSKKKAVFKVTVAYAEPTLGVQLLEAERVSSSLSPSDGNLTQREATKLLSENPTYSYSATSNTKFRLRLKQDSDPWTNIYEFVNYSVSIKGGKILNKAAIGSGSSDYLDIVANAAETVVTFKVKDANGKNAKNYTYTLTNKAFPDKKAKAFSVSVIDPATKKKANLQNNGGTQKLFGSFKLPTGYTLTSNSRVRIEVDNTAITSANASNYYRLAQAGNFPNYSTERMITNGGVDLEFNGSYLSSSLATGSYKLKLTLGEYDKDANFVPYTDIKPATVTLKVTTIKPKKASFKPTTKYSLSSQNGFKAELTGKAANLYTNEYYNNGKGYEFLRLKNTIHAKGALLGQPNLFREYFDVTDGVISLQPISVLEANEKTKSVVVTDTTTGQKYVDVSKISKDDLTGYVVWTAAGYGLSWGAENDTKITISFTKGDKATVSYALSTASVLKDAEGKAKASVILYDKKDSKKAKIDMAAVYTEAEGVTATLVEPGDTWTGDYDYIALDLASPKDGKNNISIYVVPANSYYASIITNPENAANKNDLIKKYGVLLTTTVTVGNPETQTGKISIASKDKKQTFNRNNYFWDGKYYTAVPYTKTVDCEITSITPVDTEGVNKVFTFDTSVENGQECIRIGIKKADMAAAIEGTTARSPKKFSNVKAILHFDAEDKIKTEEITFTTLTMPVEISSYTYDTVLEDLAEGGEGREAIEALTANYSNGSTDAVEQVVSFLWDRYQSDSGFVFDGSKIKEEITAPGLTTDGSVKVTVPIWKSEGTVDTNSGVEGYENWITTPTTELEFTLTIPKTVTAGASDVADWFRTSAKWNNPDVSGSKYELNPEKAYTNKTTGEDILEEARTFMDEQAEEKGINVDDIRLYLDNFDLAPATEENPGEINITIVVKDVVTDVTVKMNFHYKIEKLQGLSDAETDLLAAFVAFGGEASNKTTQSDVEKRINETITNENIKWAWAKKTSGEQTSNEIDYTKDEATTEETGSITGKITISKPDSANEAEKTGKTVEVNITIPTFHSAGDAIDEVTKALGQDGNKVATIAKEKGYDKDAIQAEIAKAANEILKKDPYVAECGTVTIDKMPKLENGQISYTLTVKVADAETLKNFTKVKDSLGSAGDTVTADTKTNPIVVTKATLPKDSALETLSDAIKALEAYFQPDEGESDFTASEKTTAQAVESAAKAELSAFENVTVEVKQKAEGGDEFERIAATFESPAMIIITLTLSKTDNTIGQKEDPIDLTLTLKYGAKLPADQSTLEPVIKAAVAAIPMTAADLQGDAKATKISAIVEAANAAIEGSEYTASKKSDSDLTEDPAAKATVNKKGTAKITLEVKKGDNDSFNVECTLTIAKLDQDKDAAKAAANAAIKEYLESIKDSATFKQVTLLDKLNNEETGVLKNGVWVASAEDDSLQCTGDGELKFSGTITIKHPESNEDDPDTFTIDLAKIELSQD